MTTEENKAVVRQFIEEVVNGGNLALIDELVGGEFVTHNQFPGVTSRSRDSIKEFVALSRRGLPDGHWTIDDLIAEGDKVVWRWTAHATHRGEFLGMTPTGKHVMWSGITIFRVVGGKIVERWAESDALGLMQQLRAILAAA